MFPKTLVARKLVVSITSVPVASKPVAHIWKYKFVQVLGHGCCAHTLLGLAARTAVGACALAISGCSIPTGIAAFACFLFGAFSSSTIRMIKHDMCKNMQQA